MLTQLMRCLCNCLPRRGAARAERPGAAEPRGGADRAADLPADLRPLLEIQGIGPKTVRYLADAGFSTVEEVRAASEADLAGIEGIGPRAAATLKRALAG